MIRLSTRLVLGLAMAAGLAAPLTAVAAEELNLFAWSEYVPQSVLDGFTKETGIQVNYESYASNEEMLAKLMSGASSYDLIQPSEYVIEALVKEKLPNTVVLRYDGPFDLGDAQAAKIAKEADAFFYGVGD